MKTRALPRGLCVVTDAELAGPHLLVNAVHHAVVGGARIVRYRDESTDHGRRVREAAALRDICHEHNAVFLIDHDVRLATEVRADGAHLTRADRSVAAARDALGPDGILGMECYDSVGHARRAVSDGADYIAFGPFFPSLARRGADLASRDVLDNARGVLGVAVMAFGGITPANGAQLRSAGADVLAVCGGVFDHRDPESAARHYAVLFDDH